MITPDDLRDVTRQSGFKHVSYNKPERPSPTSHGGGAKRFQAQSASKRSAWNWFRGPMRATALEAARDYCNFVNNNPVAPPEEVRGRGGVKLAGHVYDATPQEIPSDIEAAYGMIRDFKAQQAGKPGYVYLIVESRGPEDVLTYGKIGYSTNPAKRVAEIQTGNPRKLRLYATKLGTLEDERRLHEKHIDKNVMQEWFRLDAELLSEFNNDAEEAA